LTVISRGSHAAIVSNSHSINNNTIYVTLISTTITHTLYILVLPTITRLYQLSLCFTQNRSHFA
jgi:hypothetical protein